MPDVGTSPLRRNRRSARAAMSRLAMRLSAHHAAFLAHPCAPRRLACHGSRRTLAVRATDDASTSAGLPKVLVIAGPTAVGKTSLSLRMASALNGEIVSADSVQVFEGLDVGASKLPVNERNGIPHHLLDVADPSQEFGAGEFYEHALEAIDGIVSRGKTPIVVGGTGMYLRWLIDGKPSTPPSEPEAAARAKEAVRAAAEREMSRLKKSGADGDDVGNGWAGAVRALADAGDPETANRLAENDWYRLERAMEIVQTSGRPVGSFKPASRPRYDFRCVVLTSPRIELYRRVDARVEAMVRDGMLEEAAMMLGRGIAPGSTPAARSIGYRQAMDFVERRAARAGDGPCRPEELLEFVEETQRATRAFAKRQFTWFRGERDGLYTWLDASKGTRSELDDAVAATFHGCDGGVSSSACSDETRGEVDVECAKELKRYAPRQTIVNTPEVSRELCARVDELARRLRRVRELRARESAGRG